MRGAFFFSSPTTTTTVTHTFHNDHSAPLSEHTTFQIPVQSPSDDQQSAAAAVTIQSAYRSHVVRKLVKKISAETVDAVRSNERERIRINEALMELLFRLDSVPGFDPTVRDLRRHVSRRIVGLQEILDAVSDAKVESWDGFMRDWDDVLEKIESEVCKERGNGDLERFCAEHLGFRCLQQFLRDQW
nr:BAG family molecular chaperone regulator 5, mitochondrial [Ipomoea batatas]